MCFKMINFDLEFVKDVQSFKLLNTKTLYHEFLECLFGFQSANRLVHFFYETICEWRESGVFRTFFAGFVGKEVSLQTYKSFSKELCD